jgi:hypothetical protein
MRWIGRNPNAAALRCAPIKAGLSRHKGDTVRNSEMAAHVWPVLVLAAHNRQILTYGFISKLVGKPPVGLGAVLEPIQSYCLLNKLPPLSILVVNADTGLPGAGFIAASDIPRAQQSVFAFDWLKRGCPTADVLAEAAVKLPSNGVAQGQGSVSHLLPPA